MSKRESIFRAVNALRLRFGVAKTFKHVMYRLVNRFLYFDCLNIIVLNRENLRPLDVANVGRLGTKLATLEDLREMQKQGSWDTNQKKIDLFNQGDTCLLSYVDNRLAGYTWAHTKGCPELVPGLRISVPGEYLYNFAGFTLPDYRGYGLQSFRHHELLNDPRWKDKKGLLGFVIHTNYRSRRGQEKSGYQKLGSIWLIGAKSRFYVLIDKNLQRMGIRRIKCTAGV